MKNRSCQAKRRGKLVETDVSAVVAVFVVGFLLCCFRLWFCVCFTRVVAVGVLLCARL